MTACPSDRIPWDRLIWDLTTFPPGNDMPPLTLRGELSALEARLTALEAKYILLERATTRYMNRQMDIADILKDRIGSAALGWQLGEVEE